MNRQSSASSSSRNKKKANKKRKNQKFCVGDKLLVSYYDQELQGTLHFHGPVNEGKKGLVEMYGIELGEGEGASNGTYPLNPSDHVYFSVSTEKSAVFLKQKHILKVLTPINGKRLCVGDRVQVAGRGNGVIKFIGPTYFGPHLWYGIQLDKKLGRSDGMVQSVRYFECPPKKGVFAREEKLTPLDKNDRPINTLSKYIRKSRQEMANDLFEACAKGDIKVVRQILTVDKSVAAQARDNNTDATALMTACYHGYHNIAQELLQTRKIAINEQNYHGMTALHMAAQAGYDKICELLIKYGIDVDATTEDGTTALFNAVEKGHIKVVEVLLESNAEANLSSRDNESPLIQACHRGHHEIVRLLLKAPNIKINQKRKTDGATALFVACREGATECVRHLTTNNLLFINESKTNGRSPLFIASFFGHNEIVEMLIAHSHRMSKTKMNHGVLDVNLCDSKGFTPLFVAAQNGHTRIVTLLLQNHADVNQAEQRGHTPLWISALRGHVDVVRVLLSHPNIDIDYKDLSGVTALWAACQNNNSEVVELLLHPRTIVVEKQVDSHGHARGLSLSNKKQLFDASKMDPLSMFDNDEQKGHESDESISDLEQNDSNRSNRSKKKSSKKQSPSPSPGLETQRKGANPNLAKHDGCTPLWIAASRGNAACMQPLINYGADLNKPDRSQGATPLFVACQNGKKEAVDLLLAANADANRPRSGDGTTPLMMAAHNGHEGIVDVLLKSGADPMQANTTGLNALGCAAMQGHAEIVRVTYQHLLNVKNPQEIVDFVNAGDGVNGWTPLHLACMGGHENVIKYLINTVKVDIFKKDYENKTGLEHAW
eukprot:CAMPEP_0197073520 /NCGR_PEP_ID=MMETSP1384-20130603/210648_1 /TAXON_ID=29189 /ORGANISM="Ammonia sp." /LENGTH=829 /DNA_ID=CAMNT_0042512357 /DNA_START=151 /DNA_END=2637 /DNA_ORIENTATION=+